MMERFQKKYQLAAWTERTAEGEQELHMIPSLHHDMQEPYFAEIAKCQHADENVEDVTERLVRAYEENARFLFYTGYYGDGLRLLCMAAVSCVSNDRWTELDTDLGCYAVFYGDTRADFLRLYKEFHSLVRKYGRYDIVLEEKPMLLEELYLEITAEDRDLKAHLKEMKAWK